MGWYKYRLSHRQLKEKATWCCVLLSYNLMATVNFHTWVQNESNMAIYYIFIDTYKFTKYTVSPSYNGFSDHDAQFLTITN
jgi:hypothetical protein